MAVMQRELHYLPAVRRGRTRRWDRMGSVATLTFLGLALWIVYVLCSATMSWAQVKLDDIRYGYPRTFQIDGYIGYREQSGLPTHFTVINAHRQVLIMIIPGGQPSKVSVIKGPYLFGPGQEFSPPTLELGDVNHDGFPDLHLYVAGQSLVYLNDPHHHTFIVAHTQEGASR